MVLTSSILGIFMSSLSDIMNHVLCIATGYLGKRVATRMDVLA